MRGKKAVLEVSPGNAQSGGGDQLEGSRSACKGRKKRWQTLLSGGWRARQDDSVAGLRGTVEIIGRTPKVTRVKAGT